jgi:hypothetical protein
MKSGFHFATTLHGGATFPFVLSIQASGPPKKMKMGHPLKVCRLQFYFDVAKGPMGQQKLCHCPKKQFSHGPNTGAIHD